MRKRKIFRVVRISLLIYGVVGIALFYLQDYIILRPVVLPPGYKFTFDIPFREVNIPVDDKSTLNLVQFLPADPTPRGIVLYFHGNRTNITRYARFAPFFTRSGYEVWMMDYPGYGKSTGKFTEETVYKWSMAVYKLARSRFPAGKIVIYGKSLGTGAAAQLAAVRNCQYLLLETPYYSLPAVIGFYAPLMPVNRLIRSKFPTYEYLPKVTDPVVIFHGTGDWVVPYSNAKKLLPFLKKNDELITLAGGTHNNLFDFPAVGAKIDSLLR